MTSRYRHWCSAYRTGSPPMPHHSSFVPNAEACAFRYARASARLILPLPCTCASDANHAVILHLSVLSTQLLCAAQASSMVLKSRILHLPLAFNERWNNQAVQKYMRSVRPEAPYLPSNVDFIAANNGLQSAEDVKGTVMAASYIVLGLGDVYLGAPCAVPVDPRWVVLFFGFECRLDMSVMGCLALLYCL